MMMVTMMMMMMHNLILWTIAVKKTKSSALTRGSPMQTLLPWPKGTKWSGLQN